MKMELLETYEELIESKPDSISFFWKGLQIFLYFAGFISGHVSGILFHILWYEIFAGNCPIRAKVPFEPEMKLSESEKEPSIVDEIEASLPDDWRHKITVLFTPAGRCNFYLLISFVSCVFGFIWMTLFCMCGKGGHDTRRFEAPWIIVPPAIIFQFVLTILVWYAVNDFVSGVTTFLNNFAHVTTTMKIPQLINVTKPCEIMHMYLEVSGPIEYKICKIYPILQILSWIMAWSWTLGLIALILRIIRVRDFSLLTIKIYKISEKEVKQGVKLKMSYESSDSM